MGRRPNHTEHLTDAGVDALIGEHLRVYDSAAPGLHLRVTRGSKAWKIGPDIIGKFPAMSVAEAREIAAAKAPTSLTYLSVCSGIEAASCAWEPVGFKPVGFSELREIVDTDERRRPNPAYVFLREKYPNVRLFGDFTKIKKAKADILVGGTPCQSFSAMGDGEGLDDERGKLTFDFLDLARRIDASWLVLENSPRLISDDDGRTFRRWLGAASERGYHVAWRVLNTTQFGLPTSRSRLFVVGHKRGPGGPAYCLLGGRGPRWPHPWLAISRTGGGEHGFHAGARGVAARGDELEQKKRSARIFDTSRTEQYKIQAHHEVIPTIRHERTNSFAVIDGDELPRRITILEYERAMGFPDNYTSFTWKGGPASPAMRQALLGNSFSPAILHWVGRGIAEANQTLSVTRAR